MTSIITHKTRMRTYRQIIQSKSIKAWELLELLAETLQIRTPRASHFSSINLIPCNTIHTNPREIWFLGLSVVPMEPGIESKLHSMGLLITRDLHLRLLGPKLIHGRQETAIGQTSKYRIDLSISFLHKTRSVRVATQSPLSRQL